MRRAFSIREPEVRVTPTEVLQPPGCRHHWIIEPPQGTISKGICKVCGTIREFRNSSEDVVWENESPAVNRSALRTGEITLVPPDTTGDY